MVRRLFLVTLRNRDEHLANLKMTQNERRKYRKVPGLLALNPGQWTVQIGSLWMHLNGGIYYEH
jgi:hypothetical protein